MVWSEDSRQLSDRLQVMADKIRSGETCADIGTDHGYLGLYLHEKGISPRVILTDISELSLAKAKAAFGAGQFGNDVSFRVGNGLEVIEPEEADCVVIAGMGGLLIRDILAADIDKALLFKRLILQPRTASGPLRKWLLEAGFAFLAEDIVREGDFLPEIITVAPNDSSRFQYMDFDYFDHEPGSVLPEGKIIDLASGIRESLIGHIEDEPGIDSRDSLPEDSIHFSVPVWILNATGPVVEFIERRINMHEDILAGLKKARDPDESLISRAEYDIDYLRQLKEIRILREQKDAEENAEEADMEKGNRISTIVALMERIAPTFWFEDEDNSGIQIDCGRKKIHRILVCLEINDDIIAEAKKKKVDMIITHHPLLFNPINRISPDTPVGKYVLALIDAGISVYSSHLAFDTAPMGNNMYLAKLLKLKDVTVPDEWDDDDEIEDDDDLDVDIDDDDDDDLDDVITVRRVSFDGREPVYYEVENENEDKFEYDIEEVGNIGYLPKAMNFRQFCTYVERCLDLPKNYIRCVDGGCEKIEKIAFCTGAGGEYIYRAVALGCDAYVTGDLKLHEAQYAKAMGLTVIDAGHYGTEKIFTENMAAQLRQAAEETGEKLEVIEAESNTNPYVL